jgi:hypothetical protein
MSWGSTLLSVLSVVIGYVGVLAPNTSVGRYLVVAFTIPVIVVFLIVMRRQVDIPVPEDRCLECGVADAMAAIAVKPEAYPLCRHLSVSHANGVAVAAVVAKAMWVSIRHLQGVLTNRCKEMQAERIFSVDVVETHTKRLRRIQTLTTGLVNRANFIAQCYGNIPGAGKIVESLVRMCRELDCELFDRFESFSKSIPGNVKRHEQREPWKQRIKELVCIEAPGRLIGAIDTLREVEEPAGVLLRSLESDWRKDMQYVSKTNGCEPSAQRVIAPPQLIPQALLPTEIEV